MKSIEYDEMVLTQYKRSYTHTHAYIDITKIMRDLVKREISKYILVYRH